MDVVIESHIPYTEGLFADDDRVTVRRLAPEQITPEAMREADALITRTRTRCDDTLLSGSRCTMIASATIGLDHVDLHWCNTHGIEVANAPGCNAPAVAQYVLASLQSLHGGDLAGMRLGIVGVGHVGTIVRRWAEGLGIEVLACDPPRADDPADLPDIEFLPLSHLAQKADAITFHTPLTRTGAYPTFHLADERLFDSLKRRPTIINSARGAVVDNSALLTAIGRRQIGPVAIDCWEGEPAISLQLLSHADIATPHIAGYSRQGKIRATAMAVEAVCRHFALPVPPLSVGIPGPAPENVTSSDIADTYNPVADTAALKAHPGQFEALRNHYQLRNEPGFSLVI